MSRSASYASLSSFDGSRDNNFNLIRFLAAIAVLFSHSYLLTLGYETTDPLYQLTGRTSGGHAVDIFFATSGFLIVSSMVRRPQVARFVKARIYRIYPALLVAVAFCAFIVGPMFSELSLREYLSSLQVYWFVLANSMLEPFPLQYTLPGVFEGNPFPHDINGSLWTLPHEIKAYLGTGLLFFAGLLVLKRRKVFLLAFPLIAVAFLFLYGLQNWGVVGFVPDYVRLYFLFTFGGCLFLWRKQVILSLPLATVLLVLAFGFALWIGPSVLLDLAWLIALPYILLCFAYLPGGAIRRFNRLGDYSYGIYIYAFPIQQVCVSLFPDISIYQLAIGSFLPVLILAVPSWHFIEKPILQKVRSKRSDVAASPLTSPAKTHESIKRSDD